ncbi:MAG: O-acetylhomoserine aminocarboxypropyltransferase/cysteine synthase [Fimbriimonadia bacterium]|jgi:O-acetylhomoserine (thiol)-lyase
MDEPMHCRMETIAVHGGWSPDPTTHAKAVPIYQTSGFSFPTPEDAERVFSGEAFGFSYTRIQNPTIETFEKRMALLEGGIAAVATASGQTAVMYACCSLLRCGDNMVSSHSLYGGVHALFNNPLPRMGIETRFVDPLDLDAWDRAVDDRTRCFYVETIGNPLVDVPDLSAIAEIAHRHGVPLIVDNTMVTPFLCRPFEHGADIVVHSATKYIGGHGVAIGGVLVDKGDFPWDNGRFSEFTEPDPALRNARPFEKYGSMAYIKRLRTYMLRDVGGCMSPFNAWLFLLGLETMHLRVQRASENAMALAEWLERHPKVAWVRYPGLASHPTNENARRYLKGGYGGMMGMGLEGGFDAGVRFLRSLRVFTHAVSLGDSKSLAIHPASTTHSPISREEREAAGVTDDFVRLSIGTENVDDLREDLEQALAHA